jgi:hypothetical protein
MRVNLAHLSPLRRGYVIGFMRARREARVELRALASAQCRITADPSKERRAPDPLWRGRPWCEGRILANAINPVALNCSWNSGGACACADAHSHLSGMTISRSLVSTTKMARSLAGSVLLALWLTW